MGGKSKKKKQVSTTSSNNKSNSKQPKNNEKSASLVGKPQVKVNKIKVPSTDLQDTASSSDAIHIENNLNSSADSGREMTILDSGTCMDVHQNKCDESNLKKLDVEELNTTTISNSSSENDDWSIVDNSLKKTSSKDTKETHMPCNSGWRNKSLDRDVENDHKSKQDISSSDLQNTASCSNDMHTENNFNFSADTSRKMKTVDSGRCMDAHRSKYDERISKKLNIEKFKTTTESNSSSNNDYWYNNSKSLEETNSQKTKKTHMSYNSGWRNDSLDRNAKKDHKSNRAEKNYAEFDVFYSNYAHREIDFKVVHEVNGDLFSAGDEYSLGHCVAEDMNMGSGIATTFRRDFKRVDELLNQRQSQGGLAVLEVGKRFIYYLVTKRVSSGKPTLETLWRSLQKMKDHIVNYEVEKLALPRIGCGLDGLEWHIVKNMLEHTFRDVNVEIKIFNFQQNIDDLPPMKLRKCNVVNVLYPLAQIECGTIVIYFGSEDGKETEDINALSEKFSFIRSEYRCGSKKVGTYIRTEKHRDSYVFCGCIVRKNYTDPFDFMHFQKCLKGIQTCNRKDQYAYVAFQAFKEDGTLTVSKIVNMMRYALTNVDVYVCWPPDLASYMPTLPTSNY